MKMLTSQQVAKVVTLGLPTKNFKIGQKFGENFTNFYAQLGMKGHNGLDLRAETGTSCYACFDGLVTVSGVDETGGVTLRITTDTFEVEGQKIKLDAVYYHLKKYLVIVPQRVKKGQLVALSDNTGKYTTGPHLHFGIKIIYINDDGSSYLPRDNGYGGCVDPEPLFHLKDMNPIQLVKIASSKAVYAVGKDGFHLLTEPFVLKLWGSWQNVHVDTISAISPDQIKEPVNKL